MKNVEIRTKDGIATIKAHVVGEFAIHKPFEGGKNYVITDLKTGMKVSAKEYATLKDAKGEGIATAKDTLNKYIASKGDTYKEYVRAFKKATKNNNASSDKESEGKKMAKTTKASTNKVSTKAKTESEGKKMAKTTKNNEVEALKKEVEMLKASIEALTNALNTPKVESKPIEEKPKAKRTRKPKTTIDTFDVKAYMSARDNNDRITEELVKALENTKGLNITRKGDDAWLYVKGETEADTKERKDIFKEMGFRWSGKENAWFIAPYPLANGKRWAAKKARKSA